MTALREQMFRVRFLKISAPDFLAWDLRGNREHWNPAAVTIVETVDQMEIARPATSSADS